MKPPPFVVGAGRQFDYLVVTPFTNRVKWAKFTAKTERFGGNVTWDIKKIPTTVGKNIFGMSLCERCNNVTGVTKYIDSTKFDNRKTIIVEWELEQGEDSGRVGRSYIRFTLSVNY